MKHKRSVMRAFGCLLTLSLCAYPAMGQQGAWKPTQPVEVISSSGVGGALDRLVRVIQATLQVEKLILTPAVVVNKPGGNGGVAVAYLNQRPGDGHYLLVTSAIMLANHIMGRGILNYTDMTPIAQLFNEYSAVIVKADSPLKTGADLIALIKSSPQSVTIGMTVLGTSHHLSIVKAARAAGIDPKSLKIVMFKSGTDALLATMGGHITASISAPSNAVAYVRGGTARIIAMSAPQRLGGSLANVPTWRELGFDSVSSTSRTVFGPRNLPPATIAYWEQTMSRVVASPMWVKEVDDNFWVSAYLDSGATKQYLAAEYKAMFGVLSEIGMAKQ